MSLEEKITKLLQIGFRTSNETEWQACQQAIKWEDGYCKNRDCDDCTSAHIMSLTIGGYTLKELEELAGESDRVWWATRLDKKVIE